MTSPFVVQAPKNITLLDDITEMLSREFRGYTLFEIESSIS